MDKAVVEIKIVDKLDLPVGEFAANFQGLEERETRRRGSILYREEKFVGM